jgi:hypothetical protein
MATDKRAREITLHFEHEGKTHGLKMELGTAEAIGINSSLIKTGFKTVNVDGHTTTRRLYPGGPSVNVSVEDMDRPVAVGPGSGSAKTNKKIIIRSNLTQQSRTIYYSGPMQSAVAWLTANGNAGINALVNGYSLYSPSGRLLSTF